MVRHEVVPGILSVCRYLLEYTLCRRGGGLEYSLLESTHFELVCPVRTSPSTSNAADVPRKLVPYFHMPVTTRSQASSASPQVMSTNSALTGSRRASQAATATMNTAQDRYLRQHPHQDVVTAAGQQHVQAASSSVDGVDFGTATRPPNATGHRVPDTAETRSAQAEPNAQVTAVADATVDAGEQHVSLVGNPTSTSLRSALLAASAALGPQQLLTMLLDQVEHRSATSVQAVPMHSGDSSSGSPVVDVLGGGDVTHAPSPSSSHSRIHHEASTANAGDPPSPPSSPPSASSDAGSSPRVPPTRSLDSPAGVMAATAALGGVSRRSLMDAKDRAMLTREIKVIELDGHKKYDAWKQDLELKLNEWGLMEFLDGSAALDEARAATDPEYQFLYGERKTKSFSALALSLSIKLREEYKAPIETQDPAVLFSALKAHFERGKENPIYLKREFYSRMLGKNEQVQQYIDSLRAIRRRIAESGASITENELARTILSNCVDVYPTVAIKHTEWAKVNTAVELDVQQAVIQLETAEQAQREVRRTSEAVPANGQGLTEPRKVIAVTNKPGNKKRGARGKSQQKGKRPRLQIGPDHRCLNCNSSEHWFSDCPKELTPELQKKKEDWLSRSGKGKQPLKVPQSMTTVIMRASSTRCQESARTSGQLATSPTAPHSRPAASVSCNNQVPVGARRSTGGIDTECSF